MWWRGAAGGEAEAGRGLGLLGPGLALPWDGGGLTDCGDARRDYFHWREVCGVGDVRLSVQLSSAVSAVVFRLGRRETHPPTPLTSPRPHAPSACAACLRPPPGPRAPGFLPPLQLSAPGSGWSSALFTRGCAPLRPVPRPHAAAAVAALSADGATSKGSRASAASMETPRNTGSARMSVFYRWGGDLRGRERAMLLGDGRASGRRRPRSTLTPQSMGLHQSHSPVLRDG